MSFSFCKCRLHSPLTVTNVLFWYGMCRTSHKFSFGFLQWVILVLMRHAYHLDIYHTHSKSFKHCCISVFIVVAKCTFSVTLGYVVAMLLHWGKYVVHVFWVINVAFSTVISVWSLLSFIIVHFGLTDPTLSQIQKIPARATWSHLAFLKCALFILIPQPSTFPLGTVQ